MLVPLYLDAATGALHAVFTERRADLRRHAGEISFPGGRRDEHDDDLLVTALREADEEIGLPPTRSSCSARCSPTRPSSRATRSIPFVGLIEPGFAWSAAAGEVAAGARAAPRDVRDGYARRRLIRRGVPFRTDTYDVGEPPHLGRDGAHRGRPARTRLVP